MVFIAALFTIAIRWKQFNCLAADQWINKIEYMHTVQQYSIIKRNVILTYATT